MGKVSYRPKRNQGRSETKKQQVIKMIPEEENAQSNDEALQEQNVEQEETEKIAVVSGKRKQHNLDSVKTVGDVDCEYHIYIEDYVYTYLYQLAAADLAKESSAVLIGEIYKDSKEAVVRAAIPIDMDKLGEGAEWIDMGVAQEIEEQRKSYFADQDIIGWMHMQPGYGTMLTMKELREHQSVFEGNGTICMLVDAINKIETVFVYEEDELKEQSGYCMYYERNEEMQQFMLDHPFTAGAKEEIKDTVVNQFREIGKIRKAEYAQRKNLNLTVMAASIILIALTAVIVKMNEHKDYISASGNLTQVGNTMDTANQLNADQNALLAESPLDQISNNAEGVESLNGEVAANEDATNNETVPAINENEKKEEASAQEAQPTTAPAADTKKEKAEEKVGDYDTYTVETGDTLADICYKQYGSAERSMEVAKFNGLSDTNQIYVGQELKMPK